MVSKFWLGKKGVDFSGWVYVGWYSWFVGEKGRNDGVVPDRGERTNLKGMTERTGGSIIKPSTPRFIILARDSGVERWKDQTQYPEFNKHQRLAQESTSFIPSFEFLIASFPSFIWKEEICYFILYKCKICIEDLKGSKEAGHML